MILHDEILQNRSVRSRKKLTQPDPKKCEKNPNPTRTRILLANPTRTRPDPKIYQQKANTIQTRTFTTLIGSKNLLCY